jgi:hypothetical protein
MQMNVLPAVMIRNLIVVMDSAYMIHGNVMAGQTALMEQMKPIVLLHLVKIKVMQIVAMVSVFMNLGFVMDGLTVLMDPMKPIVLLHPVPIKDYGIVVMGNVFHRAMYVMAQVNFVMLDGVLTVPMVQMKA